MLGLSRGELGRGRRQPSVVGIDHGGAVAQGPHAGEPPYRHVGCRLNWAALLGQGKPQHHLGRGGSDGSNDRHAVEPFPRLQFHTPVIDSRNQSVKANFDAALLHLRQGKLGQAGGELRQDAVATVQQNDFAILLLQLGVIAPRGAQEIIEFRCQLHATKPAPDNDECGQPASAFRLGLHLGLLHPHQKTVTQKQTVARSLQGQRMFGHAGQNIQVDCHAAGQHQLVVVDDAGVLTQIPNFSPVEVDLRDGGHAEPRGLEHLADRSHYMPGQH